MIVDTLKYNPTNKYHREFFVFLSLHALKIRKLDISDEVEAMIEQWEGEMSAYARMLALVFCGGLNRTFDDVDKLATDLIEYMKRWHDPSKN